MSIEEKNKEFFENLADTMHEIDGYKEIEEYFTDALRQQLDFIGADWVTEKDRATDESMKELRLLDYACGTGLFSRALAPYVSSMIGVDLSINMVNQYNAQAARNDLASRMHALQGNILPLSDPSTTATTTIDCNNKNNNENGDNDENNNSLLASAEYHNFGIVTIGLAAHHFNDPATAMKILATRLRPGGVLLVVDFLHGCDGHDPQGLSQNDHHEKSTERGHANKIDELPSEIRETISVMGFNEHHMKQMLTDAGLVNFRFCILPKKLTWDMQGKKMENTAFIARAQKLET